MDRDEETLDYNLSLNAAAEETREGYTGYTDYDPDSGTYTWVLLGRQTKTHYIREHNVSPRLDRLSQRGRPGKGGLLCQRRTG